MNMTHPLLSPDTRGDAPLWRVFWIEGVLVSHALFGLIVYSYARVGNIPLAAMLAGFVVYTAWITRRVWINAGNVGNRLYGEMARALTVAWALNTLLISLFMLLAHFSGEPFPLPF